MTLTAEQAIAKVNELHKEISRRRRPIERRENYFDGFQTLAYASDEWKRFHDDRYKGFSDNWCEVVARAAPERTELFGIRLGEDVDAQSEDEKVIWRDWEINEGPAKSSQGFLSGAVTSRSFALVWGNADDEPVLSWEHASQVVIGYSADGARTPLYALKLWVDDDVELATLYTVDQVWKFQRNGFVRVGADGRTNAGLIVPSSMTEGGGWAERRPTEDDSWPLDHDMGVLPMVEFPNRPLLRRGPMSDIDGTMAMQDAINLMWAYLFGAADHASMPARVVMGQDPPKMPILDEQGNKIGEKPLDIDALTKGRMLWLTGQGAKIGQFDSAKLDVFTSVLNVMVKHTASKTRTPVHYIMGELGNVNGETLTAAELPLAMKTREGHKHLTGPIREVVRRFALVRGNKAVAEACRTAVVQWKNPETSSDAQMSDAALKDSQVGWPFAAILERRYGLSQPQIQRVLEQVQAERDDPVLKQIEADAAASAAAAAQPPAVPDAAVGA